MAFFRLIFFILLTSSCNKGIVSHKSIDLSGKWVKPVGSSQEILTRDSSYTQKLIHIRDSLMITDPINLNPASNIQSYRFFKNGTYKNVLTGQKGDMSLKCNDQILQGFGVPSAYNCKLILDKVEYEVGIPILDKRVDTLHLNRRIDDITSLYFILVR